MLGGDASIEEIVRYALALRQEIIDNSIPNGRLEEDMGLNNQPVTPEEVKGLQDFLATANDVPR